MKKDFRNRKIIDKSFVGISVLNQNNNQIPVVISIPHSGEYITKEMSDNLNNVLLSNTDWYLDKLYSFLSKMGFTVLINNVNRYVIDVNRQLKVAGQNNSYKQNFIYTKTTFDRDMYKKQLSNDEITNRIKMFYLPYHKALTKALNEKLKHFNKVFLIDLHSFGNPMSCDIVLGNNKGKSTSRKNFLTIKKLLEEENFVVANNKMYSGGYITKRYSKKFKNCQTIQIELNYRKYIHNRQFNEEEQPEIDGKLFENTQEKLKSFFIKLKNILIKK